MTIVAARDLASKQIRVCTIAPGTFDTPLLARLPDEIKASLAGPSHTPAVSATRTSSRHLALPHRRERDAQRRDDPAGRRHPHGTALVPR